MPWNSPEAHAQSSTSRHVNVTSRSPLQRILHSAVGRAACNDAIFRFYRPFGLSPRSQACWLITRCQVSPLSEVSLLTMVPISLLVPPPCAPLHIAPPARASAGLPCPAFRCVAHRLTGRKLPVAGGSAQQEIGRPASTWTNGIDPTHLLWVNPDRKEECLKLWQAMFSENTDIWEQSLEI